MLAQYASILKELRARGVVRTRNAPLGDYAEYLVHRAYGGALLPNSGKSYDLLDDAQRRVQVKARMIGPDIRGSAKFSAFRSFDFDVAVFLALDMDTYGVKWAREVPPGDLDAVVRYSRHINGSAVRISVAKNLGIDVTERICAAVG